MPTHALVHFPNIDTTGINALRDEYDPYKDLIDVHITVIFPVTVERRGSRRAHLEDPRRLESVHHPTQRAALSPLTNGCS